MIYEFIATVTAGFGMAGIAMILRQLAKLMGRKAPKWLIPIFAGFGMLGFQIHQEYHWDKQQLQTIPESVQVIKNVEGSLWYRPWSYIKPQVIRFMASGEAKTIDRAISSTTDDIRLSNLYLFERRISTKVIPQLVNCTHPATTTLTQSTSEAKLTAANFKQLSWHTLAINEPLYQAVCSQ
ncbi:hypothetical protein [Psychrobacter sp.]|uniref:hypothetical protein n=1 Tax=Psychrobacter sp. TaxID=56811 RepID=UPI0025E2EC50|nr:hypothetical protein [Psychrobacter sp.]